LDPFVNKSLPLRVVFGEGTSARLAEEADLLAIRRALVLTTPGHERLGREIAGRLGDRLAGLFAGAVMHTPVDVTEEALKRAADLKAEGVIAVGGGSTVGLGKGDLAAHRPPSDRNSDYLRRVRDDTDPRRNAGWREDDTIQSRDLAQNSHL
jgi:alcohol dehydrogenase class IV